MVHVEDRSAVVQAITDVAEELRTALCDLPEEQLMEVAEVAEEMFKSFAAFHDIEEAAISMKVIPYDSLVARLTIATISAGLRHSLLKLGVVA